MKQLAKIYHFDSFGKREEKYDKLTNTDFQDVPWQELNPSEPYYFFVPKDFGVKEKYDKGFSVSEIFKINSMGIATGKDNILTSFNKTNLSERFGDKNVTIYNYRVFDSRFVVYDNNILQRARGKIMDNLFYIKNNLSLITTKFLSSSEFNHIFLSKNIFDRCIISNKGKEGNYSFPLYLYQEKKEGLLFNDSANLHSEGQIEKTPNFNPEIISKIEQKLGMKLDSVNLHSEGQGIFTPEDLFDYIYAVLHSKTYRETYKEFLKIDFPKIPFDTDKVTFFKMVKLGRELRSYHLMENESLIPKNFITKYEIDGDNLVGKVRFEDEKVFINDTEYFSGVPKQVWEFYIGGYQPAQKWLKDRKDRKLNYEDIIHYSKIILCLKETIRIMEEIEVVFKV